MVLESITYLFFFYLKRVTPVRWTDARRPVFSVETDAMQNGRRRSITGTPPSGHTSSLHPRSARGLRRLWSDV